MQRVSARLLEHRRRAGLPPVVALVLLALVGLPVCRADLTGQTKLRIDCGTDKHTMVATSQAQYSFEPDSLYTSVGTTASVPDPASHSLNAVEASLRVFPPDSVSCYAIPVVPGRYLVRLGWAYYSYDGRDQPPRFALLLQSTLVEIVDMAQAQLKSATGAYYSDFVVFAPSANLSVCLRPMPRAAAASSPTADVSPPFLNSLEILPVDEAAYDAASTGRGVILSTYLRLNMGGEAMGPEPDDPGFRVWIADVTESTGRYRTLATDQPIADTQSPPDYLPQKVFQSCREAKGPTNATGFRMTIVPVDPTNSWYLRYYFAEINGAVGRGQRLFHLLLGSGSMDHVLAGSALAFDILARARGHNAGLVVPVFFNFSERAQSYGQDLEVGVRTAAGSQHPALLCAVELYEIIPVADGGTQPSALRSATSGALDAGEMTGLALGMLLSAALLAACYISLLQTRPPPTFVPIESAL